MKKVLSLVLVIAMVLSSFSFAFAAPKFEDVVDTDYEKAINTLVGLGVVTGYEDGTYRPERVVTRAEMAKLIVEILGYGNLVAGSKSNFADTQGHWADAWIALAAGRGLVIGTGDGKFTPDRQVSYDEAITMVVRALGYTDDSNELKGMTWPTNFKVKAADLKLTKDVKIAGTGADRGGVAQLLYNALEANMVTVDSDGDVNYIKDGDDNKILLNALATKDRFVVAPKHLDEDDKAYMGDIVDLAPYMYQDIKVFVNDDDEVVYVTKVESDVKVGEFRSYTDVDGDVYIRIDGKNKAYDLAYAVVDNVEADTIPVYYNGVEKDMTEDEMEGVYEEDEDPTIVDLHKADATFVLNDAGDIVAIVANKLTNAARVTNKYNGRTKIQGFALPLDDDDEVDYDKLTVTGEVDTLEDIEEDDVIVLFAGAGEVTTSADTEKLVIQVVRDTVEGRITKSNKDGQFYINDKYYTVSQFPKDDFEVGLEGTFFLDHKGQLVALEEDDADEPKDYAVVTEVLDGDYNETAKRVALDAEITLVNATGEEVTFKFDNKAKVGEDYIFDRSKGESDSQTVVDHDDDLKINGKLDEYDVIKYTVNSKGKISKITIEKDDPTIPKDSDKKTDITGKKYVFASNVVVFNLDGTDVEVVDVDKLGDEVHIIASEENKNGEIEMFFVKGLGASDTYAYIVKSEVVWNDDDEKVQGLTAYVDGVEVFYEADDEGVVDLKYVDKAKMVKLELDGNVITDVTPVATATAITGAKVNITKVSGDRFRIGTNDWYTLADDVAVYILDDGEFDSVGDADSIYFDAEVTGYAFDVDNQGDNIIEILFIFE
jgi:hypothetical protein